MVLNNAIFKDGVYSNVYAYARVAILFSMIEYQFKQMGCA